MKTIFLAPRATVDRLAGCCRHHAVMTATGDWLVVAEIPDVELRALVLADPGVTELPHPNSGAAAPAEALAVAAPSTVDAPVPVAPAVPMTTRDVVAQAVDSLGMPALLELLDQ